MTALYVSLILFALILSASYIFYNKIKLAQSEYENSKNIVKAITNGFTRELKRLTKSISDTEKISNNALYDADLALKTSYEAKELVQVRLRETKNQVERIEEAEKSIEQLMEVVKKLSERPTIVTSQRPKVDVPIPVEKDAVLDNLTPTQLEVLILIEELGEGTVPEIREHIKKTREHTARLLKKLYENGFIDRNTSSMPYRYYVRKEIRELIKQQKERMRIVA
jgi:DNA primase